MRISKRSLAYRLYAKSPMANGKDPPGVCGFFWGVALVVVGKALLCAFFCSLAIVLCVMYAVAAYIAYHEPEFRVILVMIIGCPGIFCLLLFLPSDEGPDPPPIDWSFITGPVICKVRKLCPKVEFVEPEK